MLTYLQPTVFHTVQGMTSWMHTHGFSFKKPKGTPAKANPVKQKAFIQAYEKRLAEIPEGEPILFGDGVHPTMASDIWMDKNGCKQAHSNHSLKNTHESYRSTQSRIDANDHRFL